MMEDREASNKLQCIVDEGIVLNRRDMVRILRDLGQVRYEDIHDGQTRRRGEGYVSGVCSNAHSSTVIVNKRLYLNVNGFEYLKLGYDEDEESTMDLVDGRRTIRLIPLGDAGQEQRAFISDTAVIHSQGALERMLGVEPGESLFDDESDDFD